MFNGFLFLGKKPTRKGRRNKGNKRTTANIGKRLWYPRRQSCGDN